MPVSPVTPAASRSTPSRAPRPVSKIVIRHLPALRISDRSAVGSHVTGHTSLRSGFTLLELLVVIGIIAILAGIVLGVGRRASESGKIARAKAEMAALSTALEAYKSQYGDYPQTGDILNDPAGASVEDDGPGILFNALAGKRGPKRALVAIDKRAFVEFSKFSLQAPDQLPIHGDEVAPNTAQLKNAFVDPWGHRYLYLYDTVANGWKSSTFILMSAGPDDEVTSTIPKDGLITPEYETARNPSGKQVNADNLYANRN